jgi:2-(1,2-epoxy-1,2-dihydrophenyl)acetyl-CoA isomerase
MPAFTTLDFAIDGPLARIALNRPDAANGLSLPMARELLAASIECRGNDALRAVLLTGTGRFFCAGGDLKGFADNAESVYAFVKELTTQLHAAIANFARMRAPLVIAVNGAAAGAGMSLAAMGDLVLAARSVKFSMAYTAAGLVPDGSSTWYLPRIIGLRRTQELMLTNRRLSADEACAWGIVTRVVDDAELMPESEKLARHIAEGPTSAFGAVKRLLAMSSESPLELQMEAESQAIAEAATTHDGREGVAAFFAKRPPAFQGR